MSREPSLKGSLANLKAVPGVAAGSSANLEEGNAEDAKLEDDIAIDVDIVNSKDTEIVKYSSAEVDTLTKLEQTSRLIFPPDNAKVYIKHKLCDALRAHGQSTGFAITTESSSFCCTRAWERIGRKTQHSRRVISPSKSKCV